MPKCYLGCQLSEVANLPKAPRRDPAEEEAKAPRPKAKAKAKAKSAPSADFAFDLLHSYITISIPFSEGRFDFSSFCPDFPEKALK